MSGILNVLLALADTVLIEPAATVRARDTSKSGVGGTDSVSITFSSTGDCSQTGAGVNLPGTYTWLKVGAASDYEIYVTGTGTAPTGASVDAWLNLGTTRTWTLSSTNNDVEYSGTYTIRRASDGYVAATGAFVLICWTAP